MANLSQVFKNGQALRAKAGPMAINQNDVVALGGFPAQLYPVKNSDYAAVSAAGSNAVALTTFNSVGAGISGTTRKRAIVDPANNDIFIADTASGGTVNCQIWKYNSSGALQRTVTLDSAGVGTANQVSLMFLSNGNILVFWLNVATPYSLYFAIVDKALNIVVAKTTIASVSTNPQANADCIPLSGGGFAIAYALAGGQSYFTIRDNAGAVVYSPTVIAGSPTNSSGNGNGPMFRLAQQSDGNIFVGINDTAQADMARYCIFGPTGAAVKAYTVLTGYGGGNSSYPEIDTLPGFVCMAISSNKAYVFNNAGTLQGAPQAVAAGNGSVRVKDDGTYFWVFSCTGAAGLVVMRVTTAGAVISNTIAILSVLAGDVLYEQGQWVVFDGTNAYVISVDVTTGIPALLSSSAFASAAQNIGGLGDFCAIGLQTGKFQITKYLAASILGIAQTAVAAGNAGTLVTINEGPGGYITNEIKGTPGKAYDHSAATIVGNKGALYLNSVTLKGI